MYTAGCPSQRAVYILPLTGLTTSTFEGRMVPSQSLRPCPNPAPCAQETLTTELNIVSAPEITQENADPAGENKARTLCAGGLHVHQTLETRPKKHSPGWMEDLY